MIADRAQAWLRRPEKKTHLLQIMLLAAVLFHLAWLGSFLFAPKLYAVLTGHHARAVAQQPRYATIEMIMQNTKTAGGNHILKDQESNPGRPQTPPAKQQQATKPSANVPAVKDGSGTPSTPSPQNPAAQAAPSPQPSGGNPGTGLVSGLSVVPDSPDDKHPNLPPAYPSLAGVLGEQGTVQMLIHIGANGIPTAVDITRSSGFLELDNTARQAALGWHFRPVIENGQPAPSELPFAMQFSTQP